MDPDGAVVVLVVSSEVTRRSWTMTMEMGASSFRQEMGVKMALDVAGLITICIGGIYRIESLCIVNHIFGAGHLGQLRRKSFISPPKIIASDYERSTGDRRLTPRVMSE